MITTELLHLYRNNIAVIDDHEQAFTYDDLHKNGLSIYEKIGHRCLVFSLCKNRIGALAGYVSFLEHGVAALLLDASLENEPLEELIKLYCPEFLWLPEERLKGLSKYPVVHRTLGYTLVATNAEKKYALHNDLALLFTTSGSTGSPKLVRISYSNLASNAKAIADYLSISSIERPITVLPINYSFGLSVINSHLLMGATILLTDLSLMEKAFWNFLNEKKATSISGVPYTYEILKKLRFFQMDLPSLTTLTQAGGKLKDELMNEFALFCEQSNKSFFVMYGQTEATARMSYLPPKYVVSKTGSVGKPIPGGDFRLVDDAGFEIEGSSVVGELVYCGANVSMGYAETGDDLIKGDENKGQLYTGDLAKRDNDGFYYIVGRKKRFIKLFGNRISLDETEQLVKNIISDCACVGTDNQMIIYITEKVNGQDIQKYISQKTGINSGAFHVRVIDVIPKNTSGKILYSKLDY